MFSYAGSRQGHHHGVRELRSLHGGGDICDRSRRMRRILRGGKGMRVGVEGGENTAGRVNRLSRCSEQESLVWAGGIAGS